MKKAHIKTREVILHLWHVMWSTIPVNIMVEMLNLCHRTVTHKTLFICHSKMSCLTKHPEVKGPFFLMNLQAYKMCSFLTKSA